jgi:hypothetical protein
MFIDNGIRNEGLTIHDVSHIAKFTGEEFKTDLGGLLLHKSREWRHGSSTFDRLFNQLVKKVTSPVLLIVITTLASRLASHLRISGKAHLLLTFWATAFQYVCSTMDCACCRPVEPPVTALCIACERRPASARTAAAAAAAAAALA